MKKLFTLLSLLFAFIVSAQEITMQRGKFYQEGKQISSRETKIALTSNPEALKFFKAGKNKESIGGFLIGFGSALVVGDVIKGLVSDVTYPSGFTYVGLASIAASIPIMHGRKKKIAHGIELYNKGLQTSGSTTNYNMNIISNANGYGFQITF